MMLHLITVLSINRTKLKKRLMYIPIALQMYVTFNFNEIIFVFKKVYL